MSFLQNIKSFDNTVSTRGLRGEKGAKGDKGDSFFIELAGNVTATMGNVSIGQLTNNYTLDVEGNASFTEDSFINYVRVGRGKGGLEENTVLGFNALKNNSGGAFCVAIGTNSLKNNVNGLWNTSIGSYSMVQNQSGTDNVAVGNNSLENNNSGGQNIAIGACVQSAISADANVGVGYSALRFTETGGYNTAVGVCSLFTTTADNNTAIGYHSGYGSDGSYCTFVGANTDVSGGSFHYSTALGSGALITADNQIAIGTSYENTFISGTLTVAGDIHFSTAIFQNGSAVHTPIFTGGWFSVGLNTSYTITHNLNIDLTRPFKYTLLFSTTSTPILGTDLIADITGCHVNNAFSDGYSLSHSSNNDVVIKTGTNTVAIYYNNFTNTNITNETSGYYCLYIHS